MIARPQCAVATRFSFAFVLAALAVAAPAAAIWSNDPAHNLVLADAASEQVQPKIVARADGGFYVSWFDNATGGYDVRLQRLSATGTELWPHNGILVADRGYSSTTDYGLDIDAAGNALLAFRDDSQPTERIVAAKISPDGLALWGTPGIAVSSSSGFLAAPRITGTDDGAAVVAWIQDADTVLQRLDPDGNPLWAAGGIALAHSGDTFALADLHATGSNGGLDTGNVIVSWVRYLTFLGDKHIWAQKLDPAGLPLWGAGHVQVFDLAGGSLQFGNFPPFASDGVGGAVFAWYTSSPSLQVRAQRILGAGTEAFSHNGVELSNDASRPRVDPSAAFDPVSSDITAFWVEENGLQSQFGLYGQRLDLAGTPLWGSTGIQFVALSGNQLTQVRTLNVTPVVRAAHGRAGGEVAEESGAGRLEPPPVGSDALVAWAETVAFDHQPIRAARVSPVGAFVWPSPVKTLKSSATSTSRLAATTSAFGFAAYAWTDGESARDLKAQNLEADGTLGVPPLFADGFESNDTTAWSATVP